MENYELLMKENAETKSALANAQEATEAKEAAYNKLQSTILKLQADHRALHESNQAEIEGLKRRQLSRRAQPSTLWSLTDS